MEDNRINNPGSDNNENMVNMNQDNSNSINNEATNNVNENDSNTDENVDSDKNSINAAVHAANNPGRLATNYRDRQKTGSRANEANSSTDTSSGGLGAGGGYSASEIQ